MKEHLNILGNGYLQRENYIEAINCYKKCMKESDFPYAIKNDWVMFQLILFNII
jgi:hypothetical protein